MARKTIRVEIPIKSPSKMEMLGDAILAQHTAEGAGSPLTGLNMVSFATLLTTEKTKRLEGQNLHAQAQSSTQLANQALGIAPEQNVNTVGTMYYYLARFRDMLLVMYPNNEEEISKFGYNVVIDKVKGRKTIKVDIPIYKPYEIERLCDKLIARDTELGVASPLEDAEIADLTAKLATEKAERLSATNAHNAAQAAILEADQALGVNKEQNVNTSGTIYNTVTHARNILLIQYQNLEEQLSVWGFEVVIGEAHLPGETNETTQELVIDANGVHYMPAEGLTAQSTISVQNTGTPTIRVTLAISPDDPVGYVFVNIPHGVTREFLMSDAEIGDYTTAHYLRIYNPDPALDAACTVTLWIVNA